MEHLAIMKKSWKLIDKILNKEKKIESRWYKSKYSPWNKIKKDEIVYFKNSGENVTVKAEVEKVLQFDNLDFEKIKKILDRYGNELSVDDGFFEIVKDKKYCILVFLKNVKKIESFEIDKTGYGNMSAWICVESIDELRK